MVIILHAVMNYDTFEESGDRKKIVETAKRRFRDKSKGAFDGFVTNEFLTEDGGSYVIKTDLRPLMNAYDKLKQNRKFIKIGELAFSIEIKILLKVFDNDIEKLKEFNVQYLDALVRPKRHDIQRLKPFQDRLVRLWDEELVAGFVDTSNRQASRAQSLKELEEFVTVLSGLKNIRYESAHLTDDERAAVTEEEEKELIEEFFAGPDRGKALTDFEQRLYGRGQQATLLKQRQEKALALISLLSRLDPDNQFSLYTAK